MKRNEIFSFYAQTQTLTIFPQRDIYVENRTKKYIAKKLSRPDRQRLREEKQLMFKGEENRIE